MTETTEMLQWETVKMKVADLVPHIKNPKKWKPKGQEQLAESLRKYGVAGGLRCTLDGRLLDGHGRCEELAKAGYGDLEIDVSRCTRELTPEEEADLLSRFAINNRTWDFDVLKNDELFKGLDLEGIGFDAEALKELAPPPFVDYSDKNKEVDVDGFEDKCSIKLEYTLAEYEQVKTELYKIAQTPEQAVWLLLGLDKTENEPEA